MLSVVCTALNVLCHVSQTASFVLSSFRNFGGTSGLKLKSEEYFTAMKAKDEHMSTLSMCDTTFADDLIREMQLQASLGPSDLVISQGSQHYTPEDFSYGVAS